MKRSKRAGLALLSLPFILIGLFILYEIFGMCVNRLAANRQTDRMQNYLQREIPDIIILDVYTETGNTSGTGNHVDCLSAVLFSTGMQETEIIRRLSAYYTFDETGCSITAMEDGNYFFSLITSAPFADNIEGH